jgi:putative membrane-bound dehydrogenase-like protein
MLRSIEAIAAVLLVASVGMCQGDVRIDWRTQKLSGQFYSEGATSGDFNQDGDPDVAAGPFWYAGPDFKESHQFYAQDPLDPHGYSNNFFSFTDDFNGDGWDDILVYGFPGADASWFENPKGAERFWPRHQVLDVVDNESPAYLDLTGDGQAEIVCSSGGYFGFAEVNRQASEGPWKFRRISDNSAGGRFTHGLGVGDVDGDGRLDLLEKSGWWQQPESLDGDPMWKKHSVAFAEGSGSAQMFAYDVDGDGDNDVICSQNAHGFGLAWFENTTAEDGTISFRKHLIMGAAPSENRYGVVFSQLHAVELVDIDGDGLSDILTGKRYWAHGPKGDVQPNHPAVVYWFELQRGDTAEEVRWIPHLIDDDSGVGTEVDRADLNGDGAVDVIVGNKKGTFVHIQQRSEVPSREASRDELINRDTRAKAASTGLPPNSGLQPEEAAAAITVPEGFHAKLAAGEPMIHQPIAMTFDHRGRLWVAEAHTYPIRAAEGEGEDKIIILEDTDQDGDFDHRTVFIEGLNLVSGLEVGFGGVWVGAAPYLMFIADRDGDDRPDGDPEILLDGFGYQDTHETLNAFIWGPDGWLYGCHGVFTHSKVGKPGSDEKDRTPLNCGVWRYHPIRHEFDVFARGTSNPWGVDFNDYGQAFITACVIPHMYHIIQGARYQRQGGQHFNPYLYDDIKTIADHAHYAGNIRDHAWWGRDEAVDNHGTHEAGGGHAHCGAMIYLGDNWPRQYRDSIFVTNLLGNRINNDILSRVGSGFVASHGSDLLYANDLWFRCINQKYAPDGSVYMIDWYDKNACHRRDKELWDRTNGRVYQVSYGDPDTKGVDLSKLSDAELVGLQLHENEWHVRMARRLLQQRAATGQLDRDQVQRELREIAVSHRDVTRRLRAVWALHACRSLTDSDIAMLLSQSGHKSEYLRAWAIHLDMEDGQPQDLATLEAMAATDSSPLVRLYLASALQRLPLDSRWKIARGLVSHGDDATDHNLPLMIWYGIEPLVTHDTSQALALGGGSRVPIVRQYIYRRAAADTDAIGHLLTSLGAISDDVTRKMILGEISAVVSTRGRLEMPAQWPAVYERLAKSPDESVRQQAQMITVKFGDSSIFPALRQIVADASAKTPARHIALEALLAGGDRQLGALLVSLLEDDQLRGAAIRGLAAFSEDSIPAALLGRYDSLNIEEKADAVATLAARASFAHPLLDAVESGAVPRTDISAYAARQLSLLGDESLAEKVNRVWGTMRTTPAEKQQRIEQLKKRLGARALAGADLSQGRAVYEKTCGKCHRLFGTGGDIGPEITGSNRADLDYTLQNIVDPNALIGKDYQSTRLITVDGRVITGLLKEENDSALVIQTANEKLVVAKEDIEDRTLADNSVMPEGQIDPMQPKEIRDLIAYLASPSQVPLPGAGPQFSPNGRVGGAIEAESLAVIKKSGGNTAPQGMGNFKAGRWSGDGQLWWTGAKTGDELKLAIPAEMAGDYEVFLGMTQARDYGIFEIAINGQTVGEPIDLFNPEVVSTGPVSLGTVPLAAGSNELQVRVLGANPKAAKSYMFGLDYVYLKSAH